MAYRRRGNTFEINYYPQGRKGPRKWLTLPAEIQDEGEVQAIEAALKKARRPERVEVPGGATVAELFPLYLDWYRLHRKPSSFDNLEWTWDRHLKRCFGHLTAEAVNPNDLEAYARIRKGTKVSNRTVNKELSLFSGFLTWAAERNRAYITPRTFKPEKLPCSRPKPNVLTFPEAMKIANAAKPLHRAFILTFYTLGLRFNEARLLRWEDFDLENRTLRTIQKGGTYKVLPVTQLLAASLKELKPKKKRTGYIFVNPRTGNPFTDIRKSIKTATGKAEIAKHVYPHLFRHSVLTYGVGKNINLRSLQEFAGHSDSRVTEWYTHVNVEHLEAISNQLDRDAEALPTAATTASANESKDLKNLPLRRKKRKVPESQQNA